MSRQSTNNEDRWDEAKECGLTEIADFEAKTL